MLFTLVAVNGPLLVSFFVVSTNSLEREMIARKHAILDANTDVLSQPLWDFDFASLKKWARTIALDPDVAVVEILDDSDKSLALITNDKNRKRTLENATSLFSKEIRHEVDGQTHVIGTLRITFLFDRINEAAWTEVRKSTTLFVVSTISVLLAALLANRMMIGIPLSRLNDAIEATQKTGQRRQVDWQSCDEIGRVTRAFNDMQNRLDQDETKLLKVNKRLSFLYNNTPVMLFSIDTDDRIQKVSDYWLRATGYKKKEVVGRKFTAFITEEGRTEYFSADTLSSMSENETAETTAAFRKKDGSFIDVLVTQAKDFDDDSGGRRSLSVMTDISNLKAAEAAIIKQAQTDVVTELLNRAGFTEQLNLAISNDDGAERVAVLFFDLDRFKWINDNLGHFIGDRVLQSVANRVKPLLEASDKFGRFGGDEFAIMLAGADIKERAIDLANNINEILNLPIEIDERSIQTSASIGISFYPDNAGNAEELLKTSDVAMYRRKNDGRNGYCVFDEEFGKVAARQLEIKEIISTGLDNDWFQLHFQPIVDLKTRSLMGLEGLLRVNHPEQGILPPLEYIRAAEQTGRILEIGDRVLDIGIQALEDLQASDELGSTYVALNLSAAQFNHNLPINLAGKLMRRPVDARRLVLEITETVLMQHNLDLENLLQDIKALGCTFALDDFGTGFSSLSYMNRFPVDTVKIDRSFINDLDQGSCPKQQRKTLALIEGIVGLSQRLDLKVIAEGIETEEQLKTLQRIGVDGGQGYLFGKAQPLDTYLSKSNGEQIHEHKPLRMGVARAS